jgi:DNA replication protein DnaC
MNNTLMQSARKLRLSGLLTSLELRLQEAQSHQLPHAQFLELIFQDELNVREQRSVERRQKLASFRDTKTLEDFDWAFNTSIKRQQFYDLATGQFIRQRKDVLLIGPPGLGKSHLAQAIGQHAIKAGFLVLYRSIFDAVRELQAEASPAELNRALARYLKPDLLIIDDMGLKSLPAKAGEILLEIVLRRYENRSTLMTSNRPIEEWGKLLNDASTATAILDRFLHHTEIIQMTGQSYRLKDGAARRKETRSEPPLVPNK